MLLNKGKGRKRSSNDPEKQVAAELRLGGLQPLPHRTPDKGPAGLLSAQARLLEPWQVRADSTDAGPGATLLSLIPLAGLTFSVTSWLDSDKTSLC